MYSNWLVITFSFDGITVAGIIQESGFDPDIHTDAMPDKRFLDDTSANTACVELAQSRDIPLFGEVVHETWGCPNCGNRWIETLEILELPEDTPGTYDLVKCLKCGHEYRIN